MGGLTKEKKCDKDCLDVAKAVRADVEDKMAQNGISVSTYVPLSYCTQLVAGINYFIKVSCIL